MPIKIQFHKGGHLTYKPAGYPGNTCHDATRPYEEKAGGKTKTEEVEEEGVAQVASQEQQQKTGQ